MTNKDIIEIQEVSESFLPALIKLTETHQLFWMTLATQQVVGKDKNMLLMYIESSKHIPQFQVDMANSYYASYLNGEIAVVNYIDNSICEILVSVGPVFSLVGIIDNENNQILFKKLNDCIIAQLKAGQSNPALVCNKFILNIIRDASSI